ncbi:MAG TPA: ATP-binding protein [bacterium]|nr:ATP-binding protein [bacterium]
MATALAQVIDTLHEAAGSTDGAGRLLRVNRALGRLLSYGPDQLGALAGQPFSTLFEEFSAALAAEIVALALAEGHWHGEVFFRDADANPAPVYLVVSCVADADPGGPSLLFLALNYAEQHYALSDQLRRHTIQQRILRSAPLAIIAADPGGTVVELNNEARELWGRGGVAIETGMALAGAFAGLAAPLRRAAAEALQGIPAKLVRQPLLDQAPDPLVFAEFVPYGRRPGTIDNVLVFLEDRTAEVRMEDRLRETERFASLGLMAANLAHEINNPLQGLKGAVERIARKRGELGALAVELSVEGQRRFDAIAQELSETEVRCLEVIDRMGRILAPVLDLSRPHPPQVASVDLVALTQRLLDFLGHNRALRGVESHVDAPLPLPPVETDPAQVEQILTNLVLNAGSAMKGRGQLTVGLVHRPGSGDVAVEVRDSGPGVPPADAAHLFTPFFSTKRVGEGTGLGLYVSRAIAQKLGGWLEYVEDGRPGACFQLTLPVEFRGPAAVTGAGDFMRRGVL